MSILTAILFLNRFILMIMLCLSPGWIQSMLIQIKREQRCSYEITMLTLTAFSFWLLLFEIALRLH